MQDGRGAQQHLNKFDISDTKRRGGRVCKRNGRIRPSIHINLYAGGADAAISAQGEAAKSSAGQSQSLNDVHPRLCFKGIISHRGPLFDEILFGDGDSGIGPILLVSNTRILQGPLNRRVNRFTLNDNGVQRRRALRESR